MYWKIPIAEGHAYHLGQNFDHYTQQMYTNCHNSTICITQIHAMMQALNNNATFACINLPVE